MRPLRSWRLVVVAALEAQTAADSGTPELVRSQSAAVEGFTASLACELAAFGVGVKLVEPGYAPSTRFTANGAERTMEDRLAALEALRSGRPQRTDSAQKGEPAKTEGKQED